MNIKVGQKRVMADCCNTILKNALKYTSKHNSDCCNTILPDFRQGREGKCSKNLTMKYKYFTISYLPHQVKLVLSSIEHNNNQLTNQ